MLPNDLVLREFDPNTATDDEWVALYAFDKKIAIEEYPEVRQLSLDAFKDSIINRFETFITHDFVISRRDDDVVVARVWLSKWKNDARGNRGFFSLKVLPEYRNQGLGTQLLAQVANVAQQEGLQIFRADTSNHIPAGATFMRQIGANERFILYTDILDVAHVRPDQRQYWHDRAAAPLAGYTIGFWENAVPEDSLEEVAGLLELVESTSPSKNSDTSRVTKDHVRQFGENMKSLGTHYWTGYTKESATNTMIAIILAYWNPNQPDFAILDITVVKPPHDMYMLGCQLKAATLEKLLEAHPQITQIRSANFSIYEPLIRANRDLGFITQTIMTLWEIETDQIQNYLAAQQISPAKS